MNSTPTPGAVTLARTASPATVSSGGSPLVHAVPAGGRPSGTGRGPGRPSEFTSEIVQVLLAVIRETGSSDSAAAERVSLHPSTVSRWKRDFPDFSILLRSAREEFRARQLQVILDATRSDQPNGWKAAAYMLERIFPQDYAPNPDHRAKFQERYEAQWAGEEEGSALPPSSPTGPEASLTNNAEPESARLTETADSGAEAEAEAEAAARAGNGAGALAGPGAQASSPVGLTGVSPVRPRQAGRPPAPRAGRPCPGELAPALVSAQKEIHDIQSGPSLTSCLRNPPAPSASPQGEALQNVQNSPLPSLPTGQIFVGEHEVVFSEKEARR